MGRSETLDFGGKDLRQKLNVFISYSRSDLARAQQIVAALEVRGLTCTIDTRDLPYGEKWQAELRDFIKAADAIVFLVSPRSLASTWCKWEVAQVAAQSKRLIPVVLEPVPPAELPPEIGEVHLLSLTSDFPFEERADALAKALQTDRAWIKEHSRLADRAGKWIAGGRSRDHLLAGRTLAEAEQWMARRPPTAPAPSQEQLDFIVASQVAAKRRTRIWMVGLTATIVVFAVAAGTAIWQRSVAIDERNQALLTQSRFLNDQARQEYLKGDYATAVSLALEALPDKRRAIERPYLAAAESILYQAVVALREKQILSAAGGALLAAKWSPDGKRVLTESFSGAIELWDPSTGAPVAQLGVEQRFLSAGEFSSDGKRVVAVVGGNSVGIWDAADGKLLSVLKSDDMMASAVFSPDGTRIVTTVSTAGRSLLTFSGAGARLWSVSEPTANLPLPRDVLSAHFAPDGRHLVAAMDDGTATIFDVATQSPPITFNRESDKHQLQNNIRTAVFSPNGSYILTTQRDGNEAWLWSADGHARISVLPLRERVSYATFSQDGNRVVVVGGSSLRVWDTAQTAQMIEGPDPGSPIRSTAFSPDGHRSRSCARTAQLGCGSSKRISRLSEPTGSPSARPSFRPTGAGSSPLRRMGLHASGTAQPPVRLLCFGGHTSEISSTAFSADGARILTASADKTLRVWNASNGAALATKSLEFIDEAVAFSTDGRRIFGATVDNVVRVWDVTGDAPPAQLHGHTEKVTAVALSPDALQVAAGAMDGTTRVWSRPSNAPPVVLGKLPEQVFSVGFSHDGQRVVSATHPEVRIWSPRDAKLIATFGQQQGTQALDFSPDGRLLVTGSVLGSVRVWDANTLTLRGEWQTGTLILHVRVSPDGKRLLAVGYGPARIWDMASGQEVALLPGDPQQYTIYAAFSPDEKRAVIARGNVAWVWPVFPSLQDLVDRARNLEPRPLSAAQRRQYFLGHVK